MSPKTRSSTNSAAADVELAKKANDVQDSPESHGLERSSSFTSLFSLRGRRRNKRKESSGSVKSSSYRKRKSRDDDNDDDINGSHDSAGEDHTSGDHNGEESDDSDNSGNDSRSEFGSIFKPSKSLLSLVMAKKDHQDNGNRNGSTLKRSSSSTSTNRRRDSSTSSARTTGTKKRQRRMSMEEEAETKRRLLEIEAREKVLDEELAPQYRKFRPRGYKLNPPPEDRPIRIYADGVFDLFHLGHMRQLEQAKKSLPNVVLVVGVPNDEITHKLKGLTVLTDKQRYESVKHCKWVDEVIENAPWVISKEFLDKHAIDYVAHDDLPYVSADSDDIYKPIKELGQFLVTQRTEGISTSDIITKIIRDYDKYLMRNFARGASRQDLNVSWLKKNEIELKRHVNQFRESFKTNLETARTSRDWYGDMMSYVSGVLHKDHHDDSRFASSDQDLDERDADADAEISNANTSNANATANSTAGANCSLTIDDVQHQSTPYRRRSPISDFASNYSGGSRKRNFLNNVRDWMSRRSDQDMLSHASSESD